MFRYPVGIQLFNRPEYAEKFLTSLSQQTLPVNQSQLFIYIDGFVGSIYDSRGLVDKSAEVKKIATEFFPKANIIKFEKNLGIAALHVKIQKAAFSNKSKWAAFFEEDVVLDSKYLKELSTLIEIVDAYAQIGKVACFQILPSLSHLPRGHDGFYPGHGTKAFAERKILFDKKLPMLESFIHLLNQSDFNKTETNKINGNASSQLAILASPKYLGRLINSMDHDIATDQFLEYNNFLHVVSKPFLATDIGHQGVHNSVTPKIDLPLIKSKKYSSKDRRLLFKKSIELIAHESEEYLIMSNKKILDGYYVSQSAKKMLIQITFNTIRKMRSFPLKFRQNSHT